MALAAAQVVDAVAARLAALAPAGGVHTSRSWPLVTLPAWRVYAQDEAVSDAMLNGINEHALELYADGLARATDDLDDVLNNTLAASALAALFAPPVPHQLQLIGISRLMAEEGEAAVGRITLRLRATCYVDPAAPETIVPTL